MTEEQVTELLHEWVASIRSDNHEAEREASLALLKAFGKLDNKTIDKYSSSI